jgi:ribosomal protein L18E
VKIAEAGEVVAVPATLIVGVEALAKMIDVAAVDNSTIVD